MSYETIKFRTEAGHCVITLNRPGALNAINARMWRELDEAIDEWLNNQRAGALVITGAPRRDGRPCFCAGVDLKQSAGEVRAGDPSLAKRVTPSAALWSQRRPRLPMASTLANLVWAPKVSIAAVDGVCTAGGIELALSCDIILAAESAQFSDMHAKNLGWIGGGGAATSLAWRAGVAKALELCLTGDAIDGTEAHRIGLANRVFSSGELLQKAEQMAAKIGRTRPAAITMTKAACRAAQDMDRLSSWLYSDTAFQTLFDEPDADDWGPGRWLRDRQAGANPDGA